MWYIFHGLYYALTSFIDILMLIYTYQLFHNFFLVGVIAALQSASLIISYIVIGPRLSFSSRLYTYTIVSLTLTTSMTIFLFTSKDFLHILLLYITFSISVGIFRLVSNEVLAETFEYHKWSSGVTKFKFSTGVAKTLVFITLPLITISQTWVLSLTLFSLLLTTSILIILTTPIPFFRMERRMYKFESWLRGRYEYFKLITAIASARSITGFDEYLYIRIRKGLGYLGLLLGVFIFMLTNDALLTQLPVIISIYLNAEIYLMALGINALGSTLTFLFIRNIDGSAKLLSLISLIRIGVTPLILVALNSNFMTILILLLLGITWSIYDVVANILALRLSGEEGLIFFLTLSELGSLTGCLLSGYMIVAGINTFVISIASGLILTTLIFLVT